MNTPPENAKSVLPRIAGRLLLGIGAGTAGGFLARQFNEAASGRTWWGFIAAGVVLAVAGFIIVRRTSRV